MKFVIFDIKDFYPSTTQDLLNEALNFAGEYIHISKCDIDVITQGNHYCLMAPISRLINREVLLDVSMGACDGAEVCALVGTYMLDLLSKKYNKNDVVTIYIYIYI